MTFKISEYDVQRCLKFAQDIINSSNQYNRFGQTTQIQIERTYVGKLAELMFLRYLNSNSKSYDEGDMFEIFQGQQNVDSYDFVTREGYTIDIKTASKPFHKRIMVPIDQLKVKKDFYVGIELNFSAMNGPCINLYEINDCKIFGYISHGSLIQQPTQNFGEGPCKSIHLDHLEPLETLLKLF